MQENGTHRGLSTHFGLDVSDAVVTEYEVSILSQINFTPLFLGPHYAV